MGIIDRVRDVAARHANSNAVCARGTTLTYAQFIQRVDGLAADLRCHGAGPNSRVAIHLERSVELIVAMFATLAAGSAYVPLDRDSPTSRLRQIIEDSEPAVLLADANCDVLTGQAIPRLDPRQWSHEGTAGAAESGGTAYLIYTSGSTGRPKGVVISHDSLENYLDWAIAELPFTGGGVPLLSSIAFDHSVTCYFPPLLMGEAVTVLPSLQGGSKLAAELLTGTRYSYVKITPSHFRLLDLDERAELGRSTGLLMFGGERLTANLVRDARRDNPNLEVMNHYGPTETTVGCCVYRVPIGEVTDPVPIGRPIPKVEVDIVLGEDTAEAELGELLVGGRALAQGYWKLPDQTARSFIVKQGTNGAGRRWYRTGDIVQILGDGNVLYFGRRDEQVKILGHRIEVAEIEAAMLAHPSVRQVSVFPADNSHIAGLVAAVTTSDPRPSEEELHAHLRALVPSVMIPRQIAIVDDFPLNVSGKLDRQAILQIIESGKPGLHGVTIEEIVARKFAEALKQPRINSDDDFFELGGDSLATVEIAVWLGEHFEIALEPTVLFEYPTIRSLADHLRTFLRAAPHALSISETGQS
jgi:surfactin family lipopeptide synthetase A